MRTVQVVHELLTGPTVTVGELYAMAPADDSPLLRAIRAAIGGVPHGGPPARPPDHGSNRRAIPLYGDHGPGRPEPEGEEERRVVIAPPSEPNRRAVPL